MYNAYRLAQTDSWEKTIGQKSVCWYTACVHELSQAENRERRDEAAAPRSSLHPVL